MRSRDIIWVLLSTVLMDVCVIVGDERESFDIKVKRFPRAAEGDSSSTSNGGSEGKRRNGLNADSKDTNNKNDFITTTDSILSTKRTRGSRASRRSRGSRASRRSRGTRGSVTKSTTGIPFKEKNTKKTTTDIHMFTAHTWAWDAFPEKYTHIPWEDIKIVTSKYERSLTTPLPTTTTEFQMKTAHTWAWDAFPEKYTHIPWEDLKIITSKYERVTTPKISRTTRPVVMSTTNERTSTIKPTVSLTTSKDIDMTTETKFSTVKPAQTSTVYSTKRNMKNINFSTVTSSRTESFTYPPFTRPYFNKNESTYERGRANLRQSGFGAYRRPYRYYPGQTYGYPNQYRPPPQPGYYGKYQDPSVVRNRSIYSDAGYYPERERYPYTNAYSKPNTTWQIRSNYTETNAPTHQRVPFQIQYQKYLQSSIGNKTGKTFFFDLPDRDSDYSDDSSLSDRPRGGRPFRRGFGRRFGGDRKSAFVYSPGNYKRVYPNFKVFSGKESYEDSDYFEYAPKVFRDQHGYLIYPYRLGNRALYNDSVDPWNYNKKWRDEILKMLPDESKPVKLVINPRKPLTSEEARNRFLTQKPGYQLKEERFYEYIDREELLNWWRNGSLVKELYKMFFNGTIPSYFDLYWFHTIKPKSVKKIEKIEFSQESLEAIKEDDDEDLIKMFNTKPRKEINSSEIIDFRSFKYNSLPLDESVYSLPANSSELLSSTKSVSSSEYMDFVVDVVNKTKQGSRIRYTRQYKKHSNYD